MHFSFDAFVDDTAVEKINKQFLPGRYDDTQIERMSAGSQIQMAPQSTVNTTQPVHSQDSNMSTGTVDFFFFGFTLPLGSGNLDGPLLAVSLFLDELARHFGVLYNFEYKLKSDLFGSSRGALSFMDQSVSGANNMNKWKITNYKSELHIPLSRTPELDLV
ncbi:hypothetical protein NQ317_003706 [Molorchus minor]|uniref:Uncharacterized protein n=1 Tax=Molorchus minor TaxID=1323400 RepID=A0ABQ9K3Z3_9CUCU|nr:hypothetical protein NQ317_003706 [Molorchus minor]